MKQRAVLMTLVAAAALTVAASPARSISLREAVERAVIGHQAIGEADANREATAFELRQAEGLWLPTLELDASVSAGYADEDIGGTAGRDSGSGVGNSVFLRAEQTLYDGGATTAEIDRQRWRLRSASSRLLSRQEAIALDAVRAYVEVLRSEELLALARRNVRAHEQTAARVRRLQSGGGIGAGDLRLSEERLSAARAEAVNAEARRDDAVSTFRRLVGMPPANLALTGFPERNLPRDADSAVEAAMTAFPELLAADADRLAAAEEFKGARATQHPRVFLEGRAGTSEDVNRNDGQDYEATVMLRMRFTLFDGSIRTNRAREAEARLRESTFRLDRLRSDVELDVRRTWTDLRSSRSSIDLERQRASAARAVLQSYNREFEAGSRSLLDLLNAENIRFGAEAAAIDVVYEAEFAGYRLLALTGTLLDAFDIAPASTVE